MTTPVLSCATRQDLLAVPTILFGFEPHDSIVVLGIANRTVAFSARLDLDWFERSPFDTPELILTAAEHVSVSSFILIAFGSVDVASRSLSELAVALGVDQIVEVLIADGEHYWELGGDEPVGRHCFAETSVAAAAVYAGQQFASSRAEVVAAVTSWQPASTKELTAALEPYPWTESSWQLAETQALVEATRTLTREESIRLAYLVAQEECQAAVLARLGCSTAGSMWPNLAAARRCSHPSNVGAVLGVLAIASWLSGQSAAHTACLEQLGGSNEPVALLAQRIYRRALPPSWWDH